MAIGDAAVAGGKYGSVLLPCLELVIRLVGVIGWWGCVEVEGVRLDWVGKRDDDGEGVRGMFCEITYGERTTLGGDKMNVMGGRGLCDGVEIGFDVVRGLLTGGNVIGIIHYRYRTKSDSNITPPSHPSIKHKKPLLSPLHFKT